MQHEENAVAAEWIEQQALHDFYQAAPETTRTALGLEQTEIGGATLFVARNEPNILLNRVLGLGIHRAATQTDIIAIRDYYAAANISSYFLHLQPWASPPDIWNWLFDAGLARSRGWTQFVRGTATIAPKPTTLRIEPIGPDHAMDFARIAARGFDLSDTAVPALAAMVGLPGWYHFMSFRGDQPAGVAAMRLAQGLAWFDWAATDPEFRGQGSQTALLARRIQTALELDCHTLFSETGEAVPGDPQYSFRNLVRAGFRPTHTRENFTPCTSPSEDGRAD